MQLMAFTGCESTDDFVKELQALAFNVALRGSTIGGAWRC